MSSGQHEIIASHNLKATHEIISAISASKRALEKILENQTDLFCLFSDTGDVLLGNKALATYFGTSADLLSREKLKDLFSSEGWQLFRNKFEILKKHKEKRNISFELIMDGEVIKKKYTLDVDILWTISSFESISDRRGTVFTLVGRDMTELKRFQKRLSMIFNSVPLAIFHINKERKVVGPYSAYTEVLFGEENPDGLDLKKLLGKAFLNMTPHQRSGVDYLLESIGEEEFWYDIYKSHFPREIQLKDGENEMWVEFSYSPVVRDRRVEEILVVAGDVTERVRSRRIKESHDQLEGKYASIFSEIRTAEPRTLALAVIDIEHQLEIIDAMGAKDLGNPALVLPPLHSIKGTARSAGLTYITSMAHTAEDEVISSRDEKAPQAEIYAIVHRYHKDLHETWDIIKSIMRIVHPDIVDGQSEAPREVLNNLDEALSILKEESGTPEKRLAKVRDLLEKTSAVARGISKGEGLIDLREVEPRLRSLVSKTAESCLKKVDVSVKMDEVLLPKDLFAKISEMTTHLLTNAVDHGIEDLESRRKANKEEAGKVKVIAKMSENGGSFTLTIEDDGVGIDEKRIVERAISIGFITREEAAQYSKTKDSAFSLMMRQGFSTRDKETEISGRGVGLEVADRIARELSVSGEGLKVRSAMGYGSSFTVEFKIPSVERLKRAS